MRASAPGLDGQTPVCTVSHRGLAYYSQFPKNEEIPTGAYAPSIVLDKSSWKVGYYLQSGKIPQDSEDSVASGSKRSIDRTYHLPD